MTPASRTAGTGTDFGTLPQMMMPTGAMNPGSAGNRLSPAFPGIAGSVLTGKLSNLLRTNGIELSSDESSELQLLEEFLGRHVRLSAKGDVQCMLLWNEWVRMFLHQTAEFPDLIREKEFRSTIMGTFRTGIATDGWRGTVYTGIRFVP